MTRDLRRSDDEVARDIADEAGRLLLELRRTGAAPGVRLGDAGDRGAHRLIVQRLAELRPEDAVLSEEGVDDPARLAAPRVWIVDPLDGTREYGEPPRDDWAVHVALCVDADVVAGAVALPAQGVTFSTSAPLPTPRRPASPNGLRITVSRTRPPAVAVAVARTLDAELVPMGSAGAKAMAVVQGRVDAYLHAGGQCEWDSAAPVAVARSAGLHTSRIDGRPLRYNAPDAWLPDILVCRPELAERLLGAIAAGGAPAGDDAG